MIQDIRPYVLHNQFDVIRPEEEDYFLFFAGDSVLFLQTEQELSFPRFSDIEDENLRRQVMGQAEYLLCLDDQVYPGMAKGQMRFFGLPEEADMIRKLVGGKSEQKGSVMFSVGSLRTFRDMRPHYLGFAGITASQIYRFRTTRKFCGRCGSRMQYGTTERSMVCPVCRNVEYPKICPAVTCAVVNGDKICMARGVGSFRKFALIAGFVEIGETFEECVRREVMEEVGLKVKNVQYYKSQPWGFSDTEMIGFFAELDGDDTIRIQETELSEARWFAREEIGDCDDVSLTFEMVRLFKEGKNPPFREPYPTFDRGE